MKHRALLLTLVALPALNSIQAAERPNIIVIMVDNKDE